ncbi:MAG TPA: glycosyltransferase [Jiangellaceae bacterium]|nr:glycosyltransferase [Jiangellaceae bacterium]
MTTADRHTALPPEGVAVVIPAKDEQDRIAATARAAAALRGVDLVVVVDDGSADRTAAVAGEADVVVVRHSRNRGKAAALETGAAVVAAVESRERGRTGPRALLFLDADLEATAAKAAPLIGPVLERNADMTIATLPSQRSAGGGHGFVVRLARDGIERATGWVAAQPLSGQRCLTRPAFTAALPLAHGFGVEVGLTIDLLRKGYRVREVEVPFHHRVTGTDWRSQVHRGRQWLHVARALAARGVPPVRLPEGRSIPGRGRRR